MVIASPRLGRAGGLSGETLSASLWSDSMAESPIFEPPGPVAISAACLASETNTYFLIHLHPFHWGPVSSQGSLP